MTIDTISIIACILIVMLVAGSAFANPFSRKIKKPDSDNNQSTVSEELLPKISVIVLANNNAEALDAHLPIILTQDYPPGYEVIVVGENGDIPTETVMKQYSQNKHLYTTYIPHRSLFMSKSKLAVALGVKAAHNEWIVLVNSNCRPQSDIWLKTLASHMDSNANLIMGYSNYNSDTKQYYRFARLRTECYLMRQAERTTAYRCGGTNIAFRRSEFIAQDGFRGNLQFTNGEYDFIVNKYARPHSTRIAIEKDAWIREDEPTRKAWHDRNISYAHIRQFLTRSFTPRLLFNSDMTMMYTNYICLTALIIASAFTSRWIVTSVASLGLIATIAIRSIIAKNVYAKFEDDIPAWKTIFYELHIVWQNIATKIRYSRADKYDFTTHKL